MKKTLLLLLALLASITLVMTACAGSDEEPNGESKPPVELSEFEKDVQAVYASYVSYMSDVGEEPLTYEDWLDSIKGAPGEPGANGLTPHIGSNGNWWIGDDDTGIYSGACLESDDHSHAYGDWIYIASTGDGCEDCLFYSACSNCGEVKWREGREGDHKWYVTHTEATCTSAGYDKRTCISCGEYEYYNYEEASGVHSYEWAYDKTSHWRECVDCGAQKVSSPHGDDGTGICPTCGAEVYIPVAGAPTYKDKYWSTTPINFQLTESSDGGQFTAGTRRYYAGGDTSSTKVIDINIRNRNKAAMVASKVEIKYSYLPDTSDNEWSRSVETIDKKTKTYSGGKSIDIFCNFVYDLTAATVKGCFANLKANTPGCKAEYGTGLNFFRFNDSDYVIETDPSKYFDSKAGEGYFYQYMQSLTLSDDKVYCLGSNYCTDLVRAFHVVPVNIEMMNGIDPANIPPALKNAGGWTEDMSNIELFYNIVWNNKWNYTSLYQFSSAVFVDAGTNVPGGVAGADITDTLGFAISEGGGLSASGILYTSTVQILNKQKLTASEKAAALADNDLKNFVAGDYLITYPETNSEFNVYANALNSLFQTGKNNGICTVAETNDKSVSIRANFVGNKLLFGSVISLGSLEDSDYQSMRKGSGFGIVPVPVYQTTGEADLYQTFVHNNARIIAIARLTDRFEQISAFLDYQSRTSADILEMYYNQELSQSLQGEAGDQNVKMLTYIRNHVRGVFDKTYEDVMGEFNKTTNAESSMQRWHEILRMNKFQMSSMATEYEKLRSLKTGYIKAVIAAWNDLK